MFFKLTEREREREITHSSLAFSSETLLMLEPLRGLQATSSTSKTRVALYIEDVSNLHLDYHFKRTPSFPVQNIDCLATNQCHVALNFYFIFLG